MTTPQGITLRSVEDEVKESYLRYSMSVIISRALPDVRDGLKPSQRRILYAMRHLNLTPGGKHRKCAKISGDTSGDFHPHGEQVIYPTLVRMAQEWIMRYKLVDGQGNFGSVDGDPPAAMRYTEARLTHASIQLMEDLDKDTVDMVANYDETQQEPVVFPSKFPNLLCNGSSGIAVGMATNIPPHNFNELLNATMLVLDNRNATINDIMEVMPGPDFPTGGIICGYKGIHEAYNTGRGRLILRAVTHTEDISGSGDRQRIVVDELPYNVNKSRLIEHIANLINNKEITGISDLRDESDKDGIRMVMDLKRNELPDVILNQLYKYSDLQTTFGCIMLALDKGLPRTLNVKQMISLWIDHRIEVIRRRTRFELNKAEARAHILEGYLKAIDNMDEVVKAIRSSDDRLQAKAELIERFEFTERQVNAVLDLKLYQLTGLESAKIQAEYDDLLTKIAELKAILGSEDLVRDIIREELQAIQKNHRSPRRSQILQVATDMMEMEDLIANEPTVITISKDDYIKRMPIDTFREQRRGGHGKAGMTMKSGGDVTKDLYVANTHDTLLIFTTLGRCYWLKAWQVPETGRRSKGRPIVNLLNDLKPDEHVATVLRVSSFEEDAYIIHTTLNGIVKKTHLQSFSKPRRTGVYALTIDEGDKVIAARLVRDGQDVMVFTAKGMAVRFDHEKVRAMGRTARGVKGITLRDDRVVESQVVSPEDTMLIVSKNGYGKRTAVEDFRETNRGGVGVRAIITNERNGDVMGVIHAQDSDGAILMSSTGVAIRIRMADVRVMGRSTQGVRLVHLRDDDHLVAVQKIENIDEVDGEEIAEVADNVSGEATPAEDTTVVEEVSTEEETITDE
ncbi:MAG: DNA topoisomerase (ATP-hydrolyzing) subunit A [Chlamydiota bacterium]